MKHRTALVAAAIVVAACSDANAPHSPRRTPEGPRFDGAPTAQQLFQRFVALGTSNSMGVQSAGIFRGGQRASWPAQLASRVGMPMSLPLLQDPGCGPPLLPPLASDLVLVGAFGDDLVSAVMNTCAPLMDGVTLPANNVAISGANAHDALYATIETETPKNPRTGLLYSRVLAPGQTQITAMLAQQPTFVSVELAANEVLPASTGRISVMTPYADWVKDYDQILAAVKSTGAGAVLVGLPNNAANFPSIRRARELFDSFLYFQALGITISLSCYFSSNYVFVPGYVLTLVSKAPTTATCSNVPDAADYVLTPSEMSAINSRMAQMNAYIQAKASENGYAYFSLETVYGLPKPHFNLTSVLFSDQPFGPYISLDGVHPSAAGQSLLADAAYQAVVSKYGLVVP